MQRTTVAMLLVLACAARGQAQSGTPRANPKGFFLGAHVLGAAIKSDESDTDNTTESGAGLGVQAGWGFTPRWALFVDAAGASIDAEEGDDYSLAHFDVGLRFHFVSATRALVPYLDAAFTGRAAEQKNVTLDDGTPGGTTGTLSFSGSGFSLGGGLQYFFSPKLSLNAGLRWTTGAFDSAKFQDVQVNDLDFDASSTRVNLGVVWYPMALRP
jgi:opacity protein-like surface antigen